MQLACNRTTNRLPPVERPVPAPALRGCRSNPVPDRSSQGRCPVGEGESEDGTGVEPNTHSVPPAVDGEGEAWSMPPRAPADHGTVAGLPDGRRPVGDDGRPASHVERV